MRRHVHFTLRGKYVPLQVHFWPPIRHCCSMHLWAESYFTVQVLYSTEYRTANVRTYFVYFQLFCACFFLCILFCSVHIVLFCAFSTAMCIFYRSVHIVPIVLCIFYCSVHIVLFCAVIISRNITVHTFLLIYAYFLFCYILLFCLQSSVMGKF